MENVTIPAVDEYLRSLLNFESEYLKNMREFAVEREIPIVHKEVANLLRFLITFKKPTRVLELGMAIGYSALLMLETSESISSLTTFERNEWMYERALPFIQNSPYRDKISVRFEDAVNGVKNLDGMYDFVFIDAVKSKYPIFMESILPHVEKDGLIVCDNVLFRGMISDDALVTKRDRTIVRSMRKFLLSIQQNNQLNTTILPIGEGVSISQVL